MRELKEQISFLSNPTDPVVVGEFLTLRRDVMFLEFDTVEKVGSERRLPVGR